MARPPERLFLERQTYRRRRLGDAAKLLPILGGVLFLLPILWLDTARTAAGVVYLFTVWGLLIVVVAVLSRALAVAEPGSGEATEDKTTER
ncbi:MAG: hypothetical protein KJO67_11065 [Silicimonas sp.]|nr:hypothetical protein [Silicimonas sp.]